MEELYNYEFTNDMIKNMFEINNEIINLSKDEVLEKILILQNIKCDNEQIKNILESNPFYLNRCTNDVILLVKKLKEIGLVALNLLFDSNPWLLNKDSFELEEFIQLKQKEGMLLEEIVDLLDSNPYAIDEFI